MTELDLAGIRARALAATGDTVPGFTHWWAFSLLALVDEVEGLTRERDEARAELDQAAFFLDEHRARATAAEAEAAKLRARVAELEGAEEAAESVEDEHHGQDAADKAVMSLEAMAFNWIATTDIHKAISAASKIAGPYAGKLGPCIHGLVSQAWIEGANTGFDARRKLTVAARETIAELEQMFEATWAADRRAIEKWRSAHPGNEMVLPDQAKLTFWLLEQLAETRVGDAP